jgi:hypothetical protein
MELRFSLAYCISSLDYSFYFGAGQAAPRFKEWPDAIFSNSGKLTYPSPSTSSISMSNSISASVTYSVQSSSLLNTSITNLSSAFPISPFPFISIVSKANLISAFVNGLGWIIFGGSWSTLVDPPLSGYDSSFFS